MNNNKMGLFLIDISRTNFCLFENQIFHGENQFFKGKISFVRGKSDFSGGKSDFPREKIVKL